MDAEANGRNGDSLDAATARAGSDGGGGGPSTTQSADEDPEEEVAREPADRELASEGVFRRDLDREWGKEPPNLVTSMRRDEP